MNGGNESPTAIPMFSELCSVSKSRWLAAFTHACMHLANVHSGQIVCKPAGWAMPIVIFARVGAGPLCPPGAGAPVIE